MEGAGAGALWPYKVMNPESRDFIDIASQLVFVTTFNHVEIVCTQTATSPTVYMVSYFFNNNILTLYANY